MFFCSFSLGWHYPPGRDGDVLRPPVPPGSDRRPQHGQSGSHGWCSHDCRLVGHDSLKSDILHLLQRLAVPQQTVRARMDEVESFRSLLKKKRAEL